MVQTCSPQMVALDEKSEDHQSFNLSYALVYDQIPAELMTLPSALVDVNMVPG